MNCLGCNQVLPQPKIRPQGGGTRRKWCSPQCAPRKLWIAAKNRARNQNLDFTIQVTDVHIPQTCPLLGIPLISQSRVCSNNSPSLDRKNPRLGYTPENVWVISHQANTAKSNLTLGQLKQLVENLERCATEAVIYETRG